MPAMTEETLRVDANATLESLAAELGGKELLVEPLSAKQTLAEFLAEGGIGYGSANEGTFAASICRIKTDSIDYGSDHQALYNVGYPLQRMAEGNGSALTESLGAARELTVYVRPQSQRVAVFQAGEDFPTEAPADATDFIVLNEAAARALGIGSAGTVAVYPQELAPAGSQEVKNFWNKRFIEDLLVSSDCKAKILTQRSAAKAAWEQARQSDCVFFALFVYTGVLVLLSGKPNVIEPLEAFLLEQSLTWKLGASVEAAASDHSH